MFLPWISTYPKQFSSLERGITKLSGMPTSPEFVLLVQAINSNIVISFFNCANAVGSSLTFNLSERKVCQFDFGSDHKLVWKVRCIHEPLRLINRFYNVLRKNKKKVEFTYINLSQKFGYTSNFCRWPDSKYRKRSSINRS